MHLMSGLHRYRSVMIAVSVMWMMKVSIDDVVDVSCMRNRWVAA